MKLKSLLIMYTLVILTTPAFADNSQVIENEFNQIDHSPAHKVESINLQFSEKPDGNGDEEPIMLSENNTKNKIESFTAAGEHQTTIIDESGNLRIIETPPSGSAKQEQNAGQSEQFEQESPGAMPEGPGPAMPPTPGMQPPSTFPQPPPPAMPAYPDQTDTIKNNVPSVQGTYPGPQQGAYPGTTPPTFPPPPTDAFPNVPPSAKQFPHQPESISIPPSQGPQMQTGEVISPGRGQDSMLQNFPAGQDTNQNFLPGYQVPQPDQNQMPIGQPMNPNQAPSTQPSADAVPLPNQQNNNTVIPVPNPQTHQRWSK